MLSYNISCLQYNVEQKIALNITEYISITQIELFIFIRMNIFPEWSIIENEYSL